MVLFILTAFLQLEQNSSTQVGHLTAIGMSDVTELECPAPPLLLDVGSTKQTVSQPARGHHVRFLSNSISEKFKKSIINVIY